MGSGYRYPVPWYNMASNIILWMRAASSAVYSSLFGSIRALTTYRFASGIDKPVDLLNWTNNDSALLVASSPEIEYPVTVPSHVIPCGPVILKPDVLDSETAAWLDAAPTVLINLGSISTYDEARATEFAQAIARVMDSSDVQVLWKFRKDKGSEFSNDFLSVVSTHIQSGRLLVLNWIPGTVASILNSGRIACFVHHGGANSHHEAVA